MDDKCSEGNLWAIKCSSVRIFTLLYDGQEGVTCFGHCAFSYWPLLLCCKSFCLYSPFHPLSFHKLAIKVAIIHIRMWQSITASPLEILALNTEYDWFDCLTTVPHWRLQTWAELHSIDSPHYYQSLKGEGCWSSVSVRGIFCEGVLCWFFGCPCE